MIKKLFAICLIAGVLDRVSTAHAVLWTSDAERRHLQGLDGAPAFEEAADPFGEYVEETDLMSIKARPAPKPKPAPKPNPKPQPKPKPVPKPSPNPTPVHPVTPVTPPVKPPVTRPS